MTDLEFLDHYIEECRRFVNPRLLGEAQNRGLVGYLNYLPSNVEEAKGVLRARLSTSSKYYDEPEIDKIAGEMNRLQFLKKELNSLNIADAHKIIPVLQKMLGHSEYIKNYFTPNKPV